MLKNLERLIALQHLDSTIHAAERRIAEDPDRQQAFDARLDAARAVLAAAKERLAESQATRREIEKGVALHQSRLSKFREQAMAVKTNQEYHAVQHEIAFAESEIKGLEDGILEKMLDGDELTATVKRADAALASEQKSIDADRRTLAAEKAELQGSLDGLKKQRTDLGATVDNAVLAKFDLLSQRRNGVGIAEAKDGICTICHVRLRPQVFNTVRRNDDITQCDSCNRILYFVPVAAATADAVTRES